MVVEAGREVTILGTHPLLIQARDMDMGRDTVDMSSGDLVFGRVLRLGLLQGIWLVIGDSGRSRLLRREIVVGLGEEAMEVEMLGKVAGVDRVLLVLVRVQGMRVRALEAQVEDKPRRRDGGRRHRKCSCHYAMILLATLHTPYSGADR